MYQLPLYEMLKRMVLKNVVLSIVFIFCIAEISFAQNKNIQPVVNYDSLRMLGNLIQHGENDSTRISANRIFQKQLRSLLQQDAPLPLDSVKNISVLKAPDNSFTLFTWQLPSYEGSYSFFGFIQMFNKKTGKTRIIELLDSTSGINNPEAAKLYADKWYGAVYYKMLTNKKDGKTFYTLLGWKGNNPLTTQKVIEVLFFSDDKIFFGYPLFKTGHVYKNRLIFDFASQATMLLGYEENKKMIVFDHLSAGKKNQDVALVKGPDGTYDGLEFTNGHWELLEDVDVNAGYTPKPEKVKPLKDDEVKRKGEK